MATGTVQEVRPPALDVTSDPPSVFDGTTRFMALPLFLVFRAKFIPPNWKVEQENMLFL
ncbi:hypothetical protein Syun_016012 [Stephania yunnanensis]|uniref:Uncharacterized protein n=1 Tax=Stephania yunnanensis TaxID=152371 RepID=A0AAP0J5U0_9MAGN